MSTSIGELVGFLKMDSTNFEAGAKTAESRMGALGGSMSTFGKISAGVGIGAAVAVVSFVKAAGDYESSTQRLVSSAGESDRNLNIVREGMLALAGQVGYSAEELSTAMYKVESGGQHGADGLIVLKAAAQGAKAENADLAVVSDALTSALQDYHLKASDSATVTSKLVAATSQGKMTFEDLAGSLNAILPIASANHISLNDILGDMASMTVHGISAQQASQNLANAVRNMSAPNAVAAKELAALGLNATELSANLGKRGLSGTMELVSNAIMKGMGPDSTKVVVNLTNALKGMPPAVQKVGQEYLSGNMSLKQFHAELKTMDPIAASQAKSFAALVNQSHGVGKEAKSNAEIYQSYTAALGKATGGATGLNVALMLTGDNLDTTKKAIAAVSGATADAAGNVHGWDEIQGTFNQKLSEAKAGAGAMAISIGTYLLPVASKIATVFADASKFLTEHKIIAEIVAYTLGTLVVAALVMLTAATVKWAVQSALAFVGDQNKGAIWLATKIFQFGAVAASAIASGIATAAAWVAANIAMIAATGGIVLAIGAVIAIGYLIITHWGTVKRVAGEVWDWIWGKIKDVAGFIVYLFMNWSLPGLIIGHFRQITDFIGGVPRTIIGFFLGIENWLFDAGKNLIGGLINGIKNMIGNVGSAIGNVVTTIRNFLPFSPAKIGPLSGSGSPELAGRKIGSMLSDGMLAELNRVRYSSVSLVGNVALATPKQLALPGASGNSGRGPGLTIQNFHAANATDEKKLAQELDWLAKGRGF